MNGIDRISKINREIFLLEEKEKKIKYKKNRLNDLKSKFEILQKKYLDLDIVNNYFVANLDNVKEKTILCKTINNLHIGQIEIFSIFKVKDIETNSYIYSTYPSFTYFFMKDFKKENLIFSSKYGKYSKTSKNIHAEVYDYEVLANKTNNPKKEIRKIQKMLLKNIKLLNPKSVITKSTSTVVNSFIDNLIFV